MSILRSLLSRGGPEPLVHIARRFLGVFEAHGIERAHIPRWMPAIRYEDLQSDTKLLPALTPEVLDTTAQLLGLEAAWLEGTSSLALRPEGERKHPRALMDRIAAAVHASEAAGSAWNPAPLRIVTDVETLRRDTPDRQWLVLVIVQAVGVRGDEVAFRCQIHRYPFDWSHPEDRLELKAITWLVHNRLNTVVPLYCVQPDELDAILSGQAIPEVVLNRTIITDPSLDDYIHESSTSRVAKEVDELDQVLDLLDTWGLRDYPFRGPSTFIAEQAPQPVELPAAPPSPRPKEGGKRQAQQANWTTITGAAQTLWTHAPNTTIAGMIERLKQMPHLKAAALSDSAIHKHIKDVAPASVRGKPGRKPKQST